MYPRAPAGQETFDSAVCPGVADLGNVRSVVPSGLQVRAGPVGCSLRQEPHALAGHPAGGRSQTGKARIGGCRVEVTGLEERGIWPGSAPVSSPPLAGSAGARTWTGDRGGTAGRSPARLDGDPIRARHLVQGAAETRKVMASGSCRVLRLRLVLVFSS
jgi:hypothetical protein